MTVHHRPRSLRCPHCQAELPGEDGDSYRGRKRFGGVGLLVGSLLLLGCLAVAYRYKGQVITVLDLANELTGSTALSVAALTLLALVAACLAAWLLMPFVFAWAYLDLRRRFGPAIPHAWRGAGPSAASESAADPAARRVAPGAGPGPGES